MVSLLFEVAREESELGSAGALSPVPGRRPEPHAQLRPQVDVGAAVADVGGVINLVRNQSLSR